MTAAISVDSVSKTYRVPSLLPWRRGREQKALQAASFECPTGLVSSLLGPNGAGKTTIINILAGLVLPDAGEARILGRSVVGAPLSLRAEVGVATPNDRSFYWRLTGRQNLEFFAALHGLGRKERRRSIDEALTSVDLAPDADKPFRLYSAGMKQKLLIARALLGKPAVLLLDEPTTHMDPLVRDSLHTIIRERIVGQTKTTILLCTHDLAEAQELADHLIFLNDGIVRGQGSLADLRSALAPHARVELEFAQLPRAGWEAQLPATIAEARAGRIELVVPDEDAIPDVVAAALNGGGRVRACRRIEESLSAIFARLAGGDGA